MWTHSHHFQSQWAAKGRYRVWAVPDPCQILVFQVLQKAAQYIKAWSNTIQVQYIVLA